MPTSHPDSSLPDAEERLDLAASYRPRTARDRQQTFAKLDRHFADTWLSHVSRLLERDQLDRRKRLLVFTGQYTMLGSLVALEETLEAAIQAGLDPREPLEVILQCYTYAGESTVHAAAEVFLDVVERHDLLEQVQTEQPVDDVARAGRSLEADRERWIDSDREDPRLEPFLEAYGFYGFGSGLRLRPGHHINLVSTLDAVDPEFLQIWLDTIYERMYSRRVLDDATRLLCVVGNTLAVGETHQSRRHMRGALRQGADPIELLEVIFQAAATVGHPHLLPMTVDDFLTILDDEGRLEEVIAADRIPEIRRIVTARIAKRGGVEEVATHL